MNKTNEIVCLTTTLNIFRAYCIYPKKNNELNPGRSFYIKHVALCSSSSVLLLGSLMHLIHTIKSGNYNLIDQDLTYILSMMGCYFLFTFFFVNMNKATKMYMFLSDFEEYGKPLNFDYVNDLMNKLSKYHFIIAQINVILFTLSSNMFKTNQCKKENLEHNFEEVCGLIANTWLPFDIDYFPVKQIYILLQLFSTFYVYQPGAVVTFAIMETVVHIAVRLDHVKYLFVKALKEEDAVKRRKKFNFAVKYHSRVVRLESEVNNSFGYSMLCLILLAAAVLGISASGFMKAALISSLDICVGWLAGLVMICVSGQYLINKSLSVGEALYTTNWYRVESSLQRDIVIVLTRCQTPMCLRAAAFGVMNHTMIVSIVQASFSYIRLLSTST